MSSLERTPSYTSTQPLADQQLIQLADDAAHCQRCPLYRNATQAVFGEGPIDRGEWEAKVNQNLPDIDALKNTPLSFFKKRRVGERLQANFAVDLERLSITLAIGESRLEAAVDQGSVKFPLNRPLSRHGDSDAPIAAEVHSFLRGKLSPT